MTLNFIKTSTNDLQAIILIVKNTQNTDYYCMPNENSEQEIWDMYNNALAGSYPSRKQLILMAFSSYIQVVGNTQKQKTVDKPIEKFEEKTEVEEELSDREILCRAAGIVHDRFTESEPYKLLFKEEMFQYEEKVVKRRAVHKIVVVGPKKNQQHILHTHFEGVANLSFKIVPNALVYVCWTRFMSHSDEEKCKKYGDIIRFDGGLSGLINIINNVVETS